MARDMEAASWNPHMHWMSGSSATRERSANFGAQFLGMLWGGYAMGALRGVEPLTVEDTGNILVLLLDTIPWKKGQPWIVPKTYQEITGAKTYPHCRMREGM
jgi:hypothetical protein